MSEENVEVYKRAVDATNRRDLDALLDEFDPDVEWHSALVGLGTQVYRGKEGVRELFRDLDENFTGMVVEFPEVRDLGDRVLALGRLRARGHESGVQAEVSFNQLVDFRNGKVIRLRSFLDRQEALEAAGLSE
jgi:ketosteroid isomerase-like protein